MRSKLAVLSLAILSACARTPTTATGTEWVCVAFQPITYSAAGDTPETIRQIREHNAAWEAVCRE